MFLWHNMGHLSEPSRITGNKMNADMMKYTGSINIVQIYYHHVILEIKEKYIFDVAMEHKSNKSIWKYLIQL